MRTMNKCVVLLVCLLFSVFLFAGSPISVTEAVTKGWITADVVGQGGYWGPCLKLNVNNISNRDLELVVNSGRLLKSVSEDDQNMVVTKSLSIDIEANNAKSYGLYAMCTQKSLSPPSIDDRLDMSIMADEKLLKVARFIEENNYQNFTAQQAVWVITDNQSLTFISSGNDEMVYNLRSYVSKIKGVPMVKNKMVASDIQSAYTISGKVNFNLLKGANVSLTVIDRDGNTFQTLVKDKWFEAGPREYPYYIQGIEDPTQMYAIELKIDGNFIRRYYTSYN